MIMTMTQVALGAAIGGVLRFGTGLALLRAFGPTAFPLGTIAVNVIGSFLMGLFFVLSARHGLGAWNPFVMAGLLGGFTTFSAFSLETVTLLERGQAGLALAYVLGSVVLSLGALWGGIVLARGAMA
jgi:CrcB protein